MGKNDTPKPPPKPTSQVKLGDRVVSNSYWNGNDYVTKYNPTAEEQQTFDYLNAAAPNYYKDALDKEGAASFAKKYEDNQISDYNKVANENLTALKDSLVTGGQVGGSTGWNKVKAFTDSYSDTLSDISANAPLNALSYQNNLLGLANGVTSSIGNFYNTGNGFANTAANMQQQGWGQNKDTFGMEMQAEQMNMMKQQAMYNNIMGGVKMAGSLALAPMTGGASLTGLAGKTGGSL